MIRLKSPHEDVYLTTMFPEPGELEQILKLELAIRRKIVAARPFGMEVGVLDQMDETVMSYAKRLAEGDETLLDDEDDPSEFSSAALRTELSRELEEGRGEELRTLPWGIGTAFHQAPGVPSAGAPGFLFACRVGDNRYWWYVESGKVLTEPAAILRRIDPGNTPGVPEPDVDLEAAWSRAVASIVAEHNDEAAGKSAESVGTIQKWALQLLRDPAVALPGNADAAYDAPTVGRSQPVRRALGEIKRDLEAKRIARAPAATRIVDVAESFGLRKVPEAPERHLITADDVGVVCWMAVLRPA